MSQTLDALIVELRADVRGLQTSLNAAAGDVQRFSNKASTSVDGFQAAVLRARTAVLTLGAAWAGFRVGKGIVEAGMQLQAMQNRMVAATGSAAVAADGLAFVRAEAERLGLDIRGAADGFAGFAASSLRAGLTLQQTKDIFTGVSEAATSMRLPAEQVSLVFKALEQIAGKGTVSMEELRGQLGDALPGAFEIAAKAMGKTTAEFAKMVANGEVMASDFLPKFGLAVRKELGGSVDEASKGAQAAFNRLGNAFFQLQTKMADAGLLDVVTESIRTMTAALNNPATVKGLVALANALAVIAQIALQVASAIGTALYKIGEFETKALALVGLGAGAKGKPMTRIAVAPRPDTSGVSGAYTLGKAIMPAASADAKGEKARQQAAKQAEQLKTMLSGQVDSMRYGFASPEQQATMDVEKQQETLREALNAKAITEQEFRELSLQAEIDYQQQLAEIRQKAWEEDQSALEGFLGIRLQSEQQLRAQSIAQQAKGFRDTIALAAQHNKTFFALEKAAALARALISARESVVSAYAFGSRIGGPVLGAAFAGVAASAQAANISAIASTSFNGGGGDVSASGGSGGSGGTFDGVSGTNASGVPVRPLYVNLIGTEMASWSKNQIRDFIDLINDAGRDGSRVEVRIQ